MPSSATSGSDSVTGLCFCVAHLVAEVYCWLINPLHTVVVHDKAMQVASRYEVASVRDVARGVCALLRLTVVCLWMCLWIGVWQSIIYLIPISRVEVEVVRCLLVAVVPAGSSHWPTSRPWPAHADCGCQAQTPLLLQATPHHRDGVTPAAAALHPEDSHRY